MLTVTAYAKSDGEYEAALKSYYSGKYKDAVLHLKGYIAKRPDPAAYYLMGYSLYKLKRFDEANEYFRDAYLVDPAFTPMKAAADQEATHRPGKKAAGIKKEQAADAAPADSKQKPVEAKKTEPAKVVTSATTPSKTEPAKPEPPKPEVQKTEPPKTVSPAAPQATSPQPPAIMPPVPMPQSPKPRQSMPGDTGALVAIPMLMGGLFAGFALVIIGIALAFYVFFSLCMYLIAKKLNVPAAWTAWVPLLNLWAFVGSAGKPWWWILLLFVPILGFFIAIYLWMCIVENLGKNKWLGLLIIVPIVGWIYIAVLAFSKDTAPAHSADEDSVPSHSSDELE
jgi:hypothetical protein